MSKRQPRSFCQRLTIDQNAAAVGPFQPEQQAQQGRFAAATGADDSVDRACIELQVQTVDRRDAVIALTDMLEREQDQLARKPCGITAVRRILSSR
jgi:hypothetical protein